MSGEGLYERYKDSLKRGHVASLRGRLDEALDAYAEASSIAPERPTPHASAGTALLRRRRPADALRYYEAALRLAPRDEAGLLGRAQSLAALDRRPGAADAYDALAEVRSSDGRLADAVDAARRGLELAEGRERRRTLERLIERLRASEPGEPGRLALERALLVLDGPTAPVAPAHAAPPSERGAESAVDAPAAPAAETATEPLPERPAPVRSALDRDVPKGASVDDLTRRAEAAVDAGRFEEGLEQLLDLAAANRRLGHTAAALDACYGALSLDPDNLGLHLALVQLYEEHGWGTLATEKLDLLDRLVVLDDDPEGAVRVSAARAGHA